MHLENLGILEWGAVALAIVLIWAGLDMLKQRFLSLPWDDWRQTWQRWLKR